MHVLAAMPVLILDGNTAVTWNGDNPYYQNLNKSANVSFSNSVDRIAYALIKEDAKYGLSVKVNTSEIAKQPIPTSAVDALSILKNIAGEGVPAEYILTCGGEAGKVSYNKDSRLAIVKGYGCSGYADASEVAVAAATLGELKPGTYSLYALGMTGEKVVAVDQKHIRIAAVAPTPTPTPRPSGGGGGGGSGGGPSGPVVEPPIPYTEQGNLMTDSNGIVARSVTISAADKVATLFVPSGVKALDAKGKSLSEISIKPLASEKMPAVPSGALFRFAGYVYEAGPDGATFEPGITLTFDIPEDAWNALDLNGQQLVVKWYNKKTGLWEDVPTTVSKNSKSVSAKITHFSTYALFTEPATTTTPTETETPATPTTSTTSPVEEPSAEGLPMTMILIVIAVVVIAAAGYFFFTKK
jgi:hypothetical protein